MKFADGFWLNRRGYTVDYAAQPYAVTVRDNAIHVLATSQQIYHRGMTLGGVTLDIVYSSTKEDTVKVQITHFKGAVNREPKFELNEDPDFVPVITETDDAVTLTSGKTAVTVQKGMDWGVRFTYDGRLLTGGGWRATSYIQESAYLAEAHARETLDDTFWSVPAPAQKAFVREQLSLSVGEYIYGFGEKFTPFVKNGQKFRHGIPTAAPAPIRAISASRSTSAPAATASLRTRPARSAMRSHPIPSRRSA